MARLKVQTAEGRTVYVGAFANMVEAASWGKALTRCKKLVTRVAVEHKNRGCWRPYKALLLLLCVGLLSLTGCATLPITGEADERLASALAEIPREGVWEKMQCWQGMRLVVSTTTPTAAIGICVIYVNPRLLDWPHDMIRAVLAHELGHAMNNDHSTLRRGVPQIMKERQADARATILLLRISREACLALPKVLATLNADPSHPAPESRVAETTRFCMNGSAAR